MWAPQYKAYNFAFADDVAFTKGTTDDKFFYDISDLYTRKFFDYNGFSISPSIGPFDPNYVYAAMRQLISSISYITYIVPGFCTVPDLLCYWGMEAIVYWRWWPMGWFQRWSENYLQRLCY